MLSAEGLISVQRVTLDGTKIKANASGNTFRREEKLEAHLALAQQQVESMNARAGQEEIVVRRQAAARLRAARQRATRLTRSRNLELYGDHQSRERATFSAYFVFVLLLIIVRRQRPC